jgi:hypothetical protein
LTFDSINPEKITPNPSYFDHMESEFELNRDEIENPDQEYVNLYIGHPNYYTYALFKNDSYELYHDRDIEKFDLLTFLPGSLTLKNEQSTYLFDTPLVYEGFNVNLDVKSQNTIFKFINESEAPNCQIVVVKVQGFWTPALLAI